LKNPNMCCPLILVDALLEQRGAARATAIPAFSCDLLSASKLWLTENKGHTREVMSCWCYQTLCRPEVTGRNCFDGTLVQGVRSCPSTKFQNTLPQRCAA